MKKTMKNIRKAVFETNSSSSHSIQHEDGMVDVQMDSGSVQKIPEYTLSPHNEDVSRYLHEEASKIEAEAIPMMKDGPLHEGYNKLEMSKALRTTANYLSGISAS